MTALIICSVHALCDIAELERHACNRAFAKHGIPAILTAQDHARILEHTTLLEVLSHLPSSKNQRASLISTYLDLLNDNIWATSLNAYRSVFETLCVLKGCARHVGFVSEYPMLTTNLVRSAVLLTNATKLGHLTTPTDPLNIQRVATSLRAGARTLNVAHRDVEVLVAHQRDFVAAQSLGMHPRLVEELEPESAPIKQRRNPKAGTPKGPTFNAVPNPQAFAVSA